MHDPDGKVAWWISAAITGAIIDSAIYVISCAVTGQEVTWTGLGKAALSGAVSGIAFGAIGKGIKAASKAIKASKTAQKFSEAGIRIINNKYANGMYQLSDDLARKYGSSVSFSKHGFPDFSSYSKSTVKVRGLTGNYAKDAALANMSAGLNATPRGYTWHHVEDGITMMLIPSDLHRAVRHTGGAALLRKIF